jgi:ketosteroid isomerase-like protein
MKKFFNILAVAAMIITALRPKIGTADKGAAKNAINAMMDELMNVWNAKDVNAYGALLTDGGQFFGTDPSETWNKESLIALLIKQFADSSVNYSYTINNREILVSAEGNSALVLEQFTMKDMTPKLLWRSVSHVAKKGDKWMIDFASWNFILKNEDMEKLNKALE